jgi:hypothetical protein
MREHVERVTETHGITVRYIERGGRSWCEWCGKVVQFPRVRSALDYVTALHELGHALSEHGLHPDVMTRERAAWEWARKNALTWTPEMERDAISSLGTYEMRYEERYEWARPSDHDLFLGDADDPYRQDDPDPDETGCSEDDA